MPSPVADTAQGGTTIAAKSGDISVSPFEALGFAAGVAQDLRSLCDRDPQICQTGRKIAGVAMERAREGASIAASLIEGDTDVPDRLITGGIETAYPLPQDRPLQ